MIKPKVQAGDIFLVDSNKKGPRIVKFFQVAPTVYQYFWRKLLGTNEKVLYFHVGMFYNETEIIEQQGKVVRKSADKLLATKNRIFIARRKDSCKTNREALQKVATADLGQGYDVLNIIGKFLTWLTGIPLFGMFLQWPKAEVCVNRVAHWYREVFGEKFGNLTHSDVTTHEMYKYIKSNPDLYEVVFEGYLQGE